jgi:hypothetical protein
MLMMMGLISFLVCRTPKGLLAQGAEFQPAEVETVPVTDADMFRAANAGGTGDLTLEEFASYLGAQVEDPHLAAKFNLWVSGKLFEAKRQLTISDTTKTEMDSYKSMRCGLTSSGVSENV